MGFIVILNLILDVIISIIKYPYEMACVVPSRFAKLKIVEDDFVAAKLKQEKIQARHKEAELAKLNQKDLAEKKVKTAKATKSVAKAPQGAAGGATGGAAPAGGDGAWQGVVKKKRRVPTNNAQWEEWKERDSVLADDAFQEEMQQALTLSKLEFETQKKPVVKIKKEPAPEAEKAPVSATVTKKHKKSKAPPVQLVEKSPESMDTLKLEFEEREHAPPELRGAGGGGGQGARAPPSNAEIKGSQLRVALEAAQAETRSLQEDLESLKEELLKVKTRNKKLCSIIGQGEMKDKAQVLVETMNLREVQAELNAEVAMLNATLQQERSRCSCGNRQDKKKRPPAADKEN